MDRIAPPFRGVGDNSAVADTPADMVPLNAERNARITDAGTGRRRLSQRPGLRRLFSALLPGMVQAMGVLSRASGPAGVIVSQGQRIVGTSIDAGPRAGSAFAFRAAGGSWAWSVPAPAGGAWASMPASTPVSACAVHPSGNAVVFAWNWTNGSGVKRVALRFVRMADGAVLADHDLLIGANTVGGSRWAESIAWGSDKLFVSYASAAATITVTDSFFGGTGPVAWVQSLGSLHTPTTNVTSAGFAITAGAWRVQNTHRSSPELYNRLFPWGSMPYLQGNGKGVRIATDPVSRDEMVYWAHLGARNNPAGSWLIQVTSGFAVASDTDQLYYTRSGVSVARASSGDTDLTWTYGGPDATRINASDGVEVTATNGGITSFVLTQPRFYRMRDYLACKPRGVLPADVAVDPRDGSFAVCFGNNSQGAGAGLTGLPFPPKATVAKITLDGVVLWQVDTSSRIVGELGGKLDAAPADVTAVNGYETDTPNVVGTPVWTTSHDGPAIRAVACDASGNVYAAGRVSQETSISGGGPCVFKLDAASGAVLWRSKLDGATAGSAGRGVPAYGLVVDATDGGVVVVVRSNASYGPEPAPWASLFKLNPQTGRVAWSMNPYPTSTSKTLKCCAAGGGYVVAGGDPI